MNNQKVDKIERLLIGIIDDKIDALSATKREISKTCITSKNYPVTNLKTSLQNIVFNSILFNNYVDVRIYIVMGWYIK